MLSITTLNDPLSQKLRVGTESKLNNYIENMAARASADTLSLLDKTILHVGAWAGATISRVAYPEASKLLYHYIYGDGSDLELSSSYFGKSEYLQNVVTELGNGNHGPLALRQSDDWRMSLALNPYYLYITDNEIKLYHPKIEFAPLDSTDQINTIVPVGKLKVRVYDKLIVALDPKSFHVFSRWTREKQ